MTMPFVAQLRSRPGMITIGPQGGVPANGPLLTVRVEVTEAWDVVAIQAPATMPVASVKIAALNALQQGVDPNAYVMKLRGFEVLDEGLTLTDAGAIDGSIFLVMNRRRRPAR
jgi:hypothetical protein